MDNSDKLKELLQKENLSSDEKLLLQQLISENNEAREFAGTYKKISMFINSSSHLSTEEISDYILFKNNLAPVDKNIVILIPKIEEHLRTCPECISEFKSLNEEFGGIENFVASELNREKGKQKSAEPAARKFSIYRYAFVSVILLGVLYGILFAVSKMTTPKYYDLASVENKTDFYATRGRATNDFLKCLNALDEGNISEAIKCLNADIKNNPDDKTIFYSYYILGLTYLDNTKQDLAGLFPHYDNHYVDLAIKNFKIAVQKNDSGNYGNITLDAYFYLAKANLMKGNLKEAKEELKNVIGKKGSKMNEAEKILNALE